MTRPLILALVDCNNFFVSCERLFRPELRTTPTVVLSSNDGCVVSRSNEAKALDIPMGAPAFQYRQLFRQQGVVQFSANFELYGDISKRIIQVMRRVTPRLEVYSVDESFLDISALSISDYLAWGRALREQILQETGIPVSIGVAGSKTLAKLASERAKQDATGQGVVDLLRADSDTIKTALISTPIDEVWGVGRKLAPRLRAEGVHTAQALASMRPQQAQQLMGIHGRQLVHELQGLSCYPLERERKIAKSIMRSRTFGEDTGEIYVLESAIASLATNATFHMRKAGLLARKIGVFMNTNRHKPGYQKWEHEQTLSTPSNDSGQIIRMLVTALQDIHQDVQQYHRLGVFLYDFVSDAALQTDLLGVVDTKQHDRTQARMQAIDLINTQYGKSRIHYAAEDLSRSWQPKHDIRSPRYVSNWAELPIARIV